MSHSSPICSAENKSSGSAQKDLVRIQVSADKVIKSWKSSLFSFEWLDPSGQIRPLEDLPLREKEKRQDLLDRLGGKHPPADPATFSSSWPDTHPAISEGSKQLLRRPALIESAYPPVKRRPAHTGERAGT